MDLTTLSVTERLTQLNAALEIEEYDHFIEIIDSMKSVGHAELGFEGSKTFREIMGKFMSAFLDKMSDEQILKFIKHESGLGIVTMGINWTSTVETSNYGAVQARIKKAQI